MNAILIDPTTQTVSAVEVADRAGITALIGFDTLETDELSEQGDRLYFDEECFIRGTQGRFQIDSLIPVAGKGVVVGSTADGGLADVVIDIEALRLRTRFM